MAPIPGAIGGFATLVVGVTGALFLFVGMYTLFTQGLAGQIVGTAFLSGTIFGVVRLRRWLKEQRRHG